jgi:putative transposase
MARGFVYLAAVLDWFSRRVLAWRLSITLEAEFCLEALQEALARHGKPEIFNTDQGSQFTSAAFTGMLQEQAIRISMDGRGAWRDNVFVERLWRSVKYEEVYLRAYDSVSDARASLGRYLAFYNGRRPHSSLGARTPEQAYLDHLPSPISEIPSFYTLLHLPRVWHYFLNPIKFFQQRSFQRAVTALAATGFVALRIEDG